MRVPRSLRSLVLLGGVLAASLGCGRNDPSKERSDLPPIPDIELTRVSSEARQLIESSLARLRQYPGDALLNGELGMALHAHRRYQEAAILYDRARKIHPEVFRWEYYRGVALSEINDVVEAGASLRRALELKENEPNALLALAQLYFKSAGLTSNQTLEAEGEKTLGLLLETTPDYVYGTLLRAARLEEAGKTDEAIAIYKTMLQTGPAFGIVHQALARLYEDIGEADSALRHAALAQQTASVLPPGQNSWLAALSKLGVSGLDHGARGQMYLQRQMIGPAAEALELAVQAEPQNLDHRINLVAVYGIMRRTEKAQEHYRAAQRLGGADARLHLNMATIHLSADNLELAQQAYEQALAHDGALVKAHIGLGRIAQRRGSARQAESYLRQALKLEPLNPMIYWELGRLLHAEGREGEAAKVLEQGTAYSEGRTAVRLLRALAEVYERSGYQAPAKDALQRARAEAERSNSNVDVVLIDAQLRTYGEGPTP